MVDVELEDAVARIFLNRPEKANALNSAMLVGAGGLRSNRSTSHTLRVVVIAGRGRNFCGGADAAELKALVPANAGASSKKSTMSARRSAAFPFRWSLNFTAR